MNKSVLIAVQPYWVYLIIAKAMGWDIPQDKTVEVRKDYPKDSAWNKTVHIYCSKNKKSFNRIPKEYQSIMAKLLGNVIGKFVCDSVENIVPDYNPVLKKFFYGYVTDLSPTCLREEELQRYAGIKPLYFWHISDLKIYDMPKNLGEFKKPCRHNCECDDCKYWGFQHIKKGSVELVCPIDEPLTRPPQSWCYVERI